MAANTTQIARSSEVQSEAASAMAAAVEEMTVSINHVSDRATEASSQTRTAGTMATQGGEVILARLPASPRFPPRCGMRPAISAN
jgi:methyl-accepting chemotaxis protein